ncbi:hypothetical protein [Candidatus Regiella insecticola]|uniref:hypothetical protein n=1 Tax=Candidatus Regiella insecticola TaxID=138073 RepID=UPI0015968D4C|nr:hypothetical protein [Candidatus Regiella insecticola]
MPQKRSVFIKQQVYYVIVPSDKGRHITINNHDDSTSLEQLAEDTLVLPLLIKDIRLSKKNNDIVLSHRDAPELHPIVRIVNFMQDVRYRHIALQDGNDTRLPLVLDKVGNPSLGQVKVTSDDDIITLYHESMLSNELIDNH